MTLRCCFEDSPGLGQVGGVGACRALSNLGELGQCQSTTRLQSPQKRAEVEICVFF